MSDTPRPITPDQLRKTMSFKPPVVSGVEKKPDASLEGGRAGQNTGIFTGRERAVRFVVPPPEPDDTHRQLVLEALEQMFIANAQTLYLDPGSETVRLALGLSGKLTELAVLPLSVGRIMVETVRRESNVAVSDEHSVFGKFYDGLLRVEFRNTERRLRVHLIPTAHGLSVSLKLLHSSPAAGMELHALGFSEAQLPLVESAVAGDSGVVLIGGPDPLFLAQTLNVLLARAAAAGRRPALIASDAGDDIAGVARIEVGADDARQAHALRKAAEAGSACLAIEQPGPAAAAAAVDAALTRQALVLVALTSRSAVHAVSAFSALGLSSSQLAALSFATCQVQIPLLCSGCARWGEVSRDDLKFFDVNVVSQQNFYIRNGCPKCNGQIAEFSSVFEILSLPDSARNALRSGQPLHELQSDLAGTPGYVPLLQAIAEAARDGKCSLTEARQYLMWQLPPLRPAAK